MDRGPIILIHIITPCTRSENLKRIEHSIRAASSANAEVDWIVVFDAAEVPDTPKLSARAYAISKDGIGDMGNPQRNLGIDMVDPNSEEYVVFLDDDNILHPSFLGTLVAASEEYPGWAMQFNQVFKTGQPRILVSPAGPAPGHCDTAQFAIPRQMIGSLRWEPYGYMADGNFFSTLYRNNQDKFVMVPVNCSYYNYLREI